MARKQTEEQTTAAVEQAETAEKAVESEKVENVTTEERKAEETANNEVTEGRFIYIGPSLKTGIKENEIFTGKREEIEKYLENTLEKYPQAKLLIVRTETLAKSKLAVKTNGTLLNKYYTDLLSLSARNKED